jgi:endonuclease YncB( thermonuclease family)
MARLDTAEARHEEMYPKPAWLRQWLHEPGPKLVRALIAGDFPLHNYTAVMRFAVDGDTIEVDTILREGEKNGLGRQVVTERIRLLGYNAPELNEPGGYDARDQLDAVISPESTVYIHTYYDRRSFNRLLAWAYLDEGGAGLIDVAQKMIASGHGVEA